MKKNNKKSLSKVKAKNILHNKRLKQGLFKKDKKKKPQERPSLETSVLQRRNNRGKLNPYEENGATGKEILKMAAKDEMEAVLKTYYNKRIKDKGLRKNIKRNAELKKFFEDRDAQQGYREMLPVMTDDGWEEQTAPIEKRKNELQLSSYKRAEREEKEDDDSGIASDDPAAAPNKKPQTDLEPLDQTWVDMDEEFFRCEGEEEEEEGKKELGEKSIAQIYAEKKKFIHEQKVKMACIAMNVVQDPDKLENIKFLMKMLCTIDPRENATVYKYALVTMCQVYHNLIPGYRIQDNNFGGKMRKETLKVAKQEKAFLLTYEAYLKQVEKVLVEWKSDSKNFGLRAVSETAVQCLGDLLTKHPTFNYSVNLIQVLVPYLDSGHPGVRRSAFDSLSTTIRNDKTCLLTLQVARKVYSLAVKRRFGVKSEVLRVFLALRSSEMRNEDNLAVRQKSSAKEIDHKDKLLRKLAEKNKVKPSKSKRKEQKKMAKIREEMASINEEELRNMKNSKHSEILQKVFGLYFHVLKRKPQSKLVSFVLEGLAKFAHLISIEYFSDLLALMGNLLQDGVLGKRESFHCIQTVFTILSGQGESLNIDPHRFYCHFYRLILSLKREEREKNAGVMLEIVEQMLILRRKAVSAAKVLSYAKRLATYSLLLPHSSSVPVLAALKRIFTTFSSSDALLDPDPDGAPGTFRPEVEDPEHSNAAATAVWDLTLAQRHYHPGVRTLASNILSGVPAREVPAAFAITRKSTAELLEEYDTSSLKFNPPIASPPAAPSKPPSKRRRAKSQPTLVLRDGTLNLRDLRLQETCQGALDEEGPQGKSPKVPRLLDLDYYFEACGGYPTEGSLGALRSRKVPDFTSSLLDGGK